MDNNDRNRNERTRNRERDNDFNIGELLLRVLITSIVVAIRPTLHQDLQLMAYGAFS